TPPTVAGCRAAARSPVESLPSMKRPGRAAGRIHEDPRVAPVLAVVPAAVPSRVAVAPPFSSSHAHAVVADAVVPGAVVPGVVVLGAVVPCAVVAHGVSPVAVAFVAPAVAVQLAAVSVRPAAALSPSRSQSPGSFAS